MLWYIQFTVYDGTIDSSQWPYDKHTRSRSLSMKTLENKLICAPHEAPSEPLGNTDFLTAVKSWSMDGPRDGIG